MKPIYKYSGGKSRELKKIRELMPLSFDRVIEPFAGSGAVAFGLEKPMVVSDTRLNNIATFRCIQDKQSFPLLMEWIEHLKTLEVEQLEKVFYEQRDGMWGKCVSDLDYAKRWITIRQLVFSGMDRINPKTGKFNAPFGWYKSFNSYISQAHHDLLQQSTIIHGGFINAFNEANENDFVFLDPPYYQRNSDYGGDYEDTSALHEEIADACKATSAKWMMVHIDCPLYRDLYKDFIIHEKTFNYSQNFKGRDNTKSKVNHLYITNYQKEAALDAFMTS